MVALSTSATAIMLLIKGALMSTLKVTELEFTFLYESFAKIVMFCWPCSQDIVVMLFPQVKEWLATPLSLVHQHACRLVSFTV